MTSTTRESQVVSLLHHVTPLLRTFSQVPGLEYDDLAQEAALVVMHCLDRHTVQPVVYLKTFVHRSVHNRMIDLVRKRRPELSLDEPMGDGGCTLGDTLLDGKHPDPATCFQLAELLELVKPAYRDTLFALAAGYDAYDLAAPDHLSYDAAKMRASRARRALRKVLVEEEGCIT